jgi:hypothetical protein
VETLCPTALTDRGLKLVCHLFYMTQQQKVNVVGYLETCENKLSAVTGWGSLPTSNTIEELVEAMRQLVLAVKETIS